LDKNISEATQRADGHFQKRKVQLMAVRA